MKVLACVGYFNLSGKISVVLGLPYLSQEQFDREKEQITSLLRSPHVMSYRGEFVSLEIERVWVMPEGFGSLIWSEAQDKKASSPDFPNLSIDSGLHGELPKVKTLP